MSNFFDCCGIEQQLNRTKKKLDHGCAESLETSSYKKLLLLLFSSWDFLASSYDHKDSPAAVDLQY
jgi:hypothetical protein